MTTETIATKITFRVPRAVREYMRCLVTAMEFERCLRDIAKVSKMTVEDVERMKRRMEEIE